MKYYREQIDNDFIRATVNRALFRRLPTMIGINGGGQEGKSTGVFWICNRWEQIFKYGLNWQKHRNEWDLWDYKTYCTTDLEQLGKVYENSWNRTIVLEEAADQGLDTTSYFQLFSKAFSSISRTQGYHMNRVILITPFLNDLLKIHKRKINYLIAAKFKDVKNARTIFAWRKVKPNLLTLKEDNIETKWRKDFTINYTPKCIKAATEYTDWLKGFKKDIMDGINRDIQKSIRRKEEKIKLEEGINLTPIPRLKSKYD